MAIQVLMPHMGESVVEGKILRWLKREGEAVERDETIAEVETDKADVEIPAPAAGVLTKILAGAGETVEVGAEIAVIEEGARAAAPAEARPAGVEREAEDEEEEAEEREERPREREAEEEVEVTGAGPTRRGDGRQRITPVVARLMERHGLGIEELRAVAGTGLGGRVTKRDLLAYLEQRGEPEKAPPAPRAEPERRPRPPARELEATEVPEEAVEAVPLKGLRKAIAEHMALSKRTAPHVTTVAEVDMTTLVEFRERHKARFREEEGVSLTFMPFIVRAVVEALKAFPYLNASLEGDRILLRRYYHIGVAVATEAGLVVPVIRYADRLSIRELAKALHRVGEGARARKLAPTEMEGGTFTITNPGVFGGILSTPIIHQPQAAILGVQAIRKLPVVRDDRIVIRSMMYLCLSYDHRIVDGATSVQFLQEVRRHLEDPLGMLV